VADKPYGVNPARTTPGELPGSLAAEPSEIRTASFRLATRIRFFESLFEVIDPLLEISALRDGSEGEKEKQQTGEAIGKKNIFLEVRSAPAPCALEILRCLLRLGLKEPG
tara:strand:- start:611 stop:940 length:330 start_codon:yes stop_codon:yes gene_type:complete